MLFGRIAQGYIHRFIVVYGLMYIGGPFRVHGQVFCTLCQKPLDITGVVNLPFAQFPVENQLVLGFFIQAADFQLSHLVNIAFLHMDVIVHGGC